MGRTVSKAMEYESDGFTKADYKKLGIIKPETVKKESNVNTIDTMGTGAIVWHLVVRHHAVLITLAVGLGFGILCGITLTN